MRHLLSPRWHLTRHQQREDSAQLPPPFRRQMFPRFFSAPPPSFRRAEIFLDRSDMMHLLFVQADLGTTVPIPTSPTSQF
jgi:hypothetical protein